MMGHKICFYEEIIIIIPKLSLSLLLIWSPGYIELCQSFGLQNSIQCNILFNQGFCWGPRSMFMTYIIYGVKIEQGLQRTVIPVYTVTSVKRSPVYVVLLLFYGHGKHLRSCRDYQLT